MITMLKPNIRPVTRQRNGYQKFEKKVQSILKKETPQPRARREPMNKEPDIGKFLSTSGRLVSSLRKAGIHPEISLFSPPGGDPILYMRLTSGRRTVTYFYSCPQKMGCWPDHPKRLVHEQPLHNWTDLMKLIMSDWLDRKI